MIKIEIQSQEVERRMSKGSNPKPYYKQNAYAHIVDRDNKPLPYPTLVKLFLPKDEHGNALPYEVGEYKLAPSSLRVGQYDSLEIGFINLVPLPPVKKAS